MIDRLLEMAERALEEAGHNLAQGLAEHQAILADLDYWLGQLRLPQPEVTDALSLAAWLQYGMKADRQVKELEEKDFFVEQRIKGYRETVLALMRRRDVLREVIRRRQVQALQIAARREVRELAQKGATRRARQESEDTLWR